MMVSTCTLRSGNVYGLIEIRTTNHEYEYEYLGHLFRVQWNIVTFTY